MNELGLTVVVAASGVAPALGELRAVVTDPR